MPVHPSWAYAAQKRVANGVQNASLSMLSAWMERGSDAVVASGRIVVAVPLPRKRAVMSEPDKKILAIFALLALVIGLAMMAAEKRDVSERKVNVSCR